LFSYTILTDVAFRLQQSPVGDLRKLSGQSKRLHSAITIGSAKFNSIQGGTGIKNSYVGWGVQGRPRFFVGSVMKELWKPLKLCFVNVKWLGEQIRVHSGNLSTRIGPFWVAHHREHSLPKFLVSGSPAMLKAGNNKKNQVCKPLIHSALFFCSQCCHLGPCFLYGLAGCGIAKELDLRGTQRT
jgi:hypothetical protein